MVTLTLRDDDAKLWLRAIVSNEKELSPLDPDSPSARIKAELQCALGVCDCNAITDSITDALRKESTS